MLRMFELCRSLRQADVAMLLMGTKLIDGDHNAECLVW